MPRACSSVRRTVPSGGDDVARLVDQRQQRADILGRPVAPHQRDARGRGIGAGADQPDDLVDIGDRDGQADQVVRPVARLAELEAGRGGG